MALATSASSRFFSEDHRPALSDATPLCTDNTLIETWFTDVDTRHPALAKSARALEH
ncbi:hypothetical protein [Streptomyces sp. NPDC088915]|uniref:hypothetical protein n=1 Tax=Streptomyces sp. NPDC088915 TaxID=3365912 RepID=UPI0038254D98